MKETQSIEWYKSRFDLFEKSLNGESKTPLHALRKQAIQTFAGMGFPSTHEEEWRFTNVLPIARTEFTPAFEYSAKGLRQADIDKFTFGGLNCTRLVFINGHLADEFSTHDPQPGVTIAGLKSALASHPELVSRHLAKYVKVDENAFTALSTAFIHDGAFVHVEENIEATNPIHLLFIVTGDQKVAVSPRNLIIAERGSKVSIVESYVSLATAPYLTNAVTEFVVDENAAIEHDKLQDESIEGFHIGTIHFQQSRTSNVVSNAINLGAAIARNNITAVLNGEGIESTLNGLSLATGTQHVDNHTTIDHAKPHCASHELYKSILDGKSKGVFNGKIFVRKDAQKTDAKQTNKTLLLSDDATIDTKPQLEIFADDVKCTHGATVGHLDEEQKFYLRSRGIGEEEANDLLTFAFASDVINRVHVDALREQLDTMIHARLQRGRTLAG
ncbi:MAG: Fe-S cluster assembly protein SufD [Bacteroidetes bacterium]|nr:Fe-S cluster assembly protein SufD [Bacteroidota bacterium]MCW5897278.1 Fe-S cluster assembly protein SufD [Bacteroidota bacterium]